MAESNKAIPHTPRRHSLSQSKRPRGSPTFLTPHRPQKRVPLRELDSPPFSQRRLEYEPRGNTWTSDETAALEEFVPLYCRGDSWPTHKHMGFWKGAAEFVKMRTNSTRSGKRSSSSRLHPQICLYVR